MLPRINYRNNVSFIISILVLNLKCTFCWNQTPNQLPYPNQKGLGFITFHPYQWVDEWLNPLRDLECLCLSVYIEIGYYGLAL